jgi:hypothetical protein
VCGFFFRNPPSYTPTPELDAFLAAGPPPVYIGFGSIVIDDPNKMTAIILEAIQRAGTRAIVSRGWSKLGGEETPNVLYLDDCPHEWLFQHVAAVIHHGGAGTTACGLINGKPTTIVPFFGELVIPVTAMRRSFKLIFFSQPFWGNMVAAAGAGPRPIHHKSLNAKNLADAMKYCLTQEATTAAKMISEKMKAESGVKAAVDSFHANLPLEKMQCDYIHDQPAAWIWIDGDRKSKISKVAAESLLRSSRIEPKNIKLYVNSKFLPGHCHSTNFRINRYKPKQIIIDNRRWDPITAVSSASIATAAHMADVTVGIFSRPYEEYRRRKARSTCSDLSPSPSVQPFPHDPRQETAIKDEISSHSSDNLPRSHSRPIHGSDSKRKRRSTAAAMVGASANSVVRFAASSSKGILVDIPLAATEGMRAMPRIYQQDRKDHGHVKGVKSGVVVAGKNFGHCMYEGFTDIFIETAHGKKEQGAIGAVKGLGKGLVSMATKISAGVIGLVAYPGQGVHKSIRTAMHSSTTKSIVEAKLQEGNWMMSTDDSMNIDERSMIAVFEASSRKERR